MAEPEIDVARVDPFDEPGLAAWHAALSAGATAGRTHPLVTTLPAMRASVQDPHPDRSREMWVARSAGETVGALLIELPLRDNRHLAEAEIDVPVEHRGRGVGAALAAVVRRRCVEEGRSTVLAEISVPVGVETETWPGWRFATARGLASVHVEDRFLLDLPAAPPSRPLAAAYDVIGWEGPCPEEHVEAFARLQTAMHHDVPVGGIDLEPVQVSADDVRRQATRRDQQGWDALVAAASEMATGELVGYSLLLANRDRPADVLQDDTLVLGAHRGHRLGAALKAANLVRLQAGHPDAERVQTWTAVDNAPMQHVNRASGFRPVERMHEFQKRMQG